jgi:ribonuclease J
VERLLIFRQVAEAANRRLTILLRDAYLLQAMRYISPEIPDLASDPVICIYEDAKAKLNRWEREIRRRYSSKLVTPGEIRAHQEEYILCFSFFDINELPSIMPREGSLYVYSSSEVYDEEGALDMRRLHHWLDHFGINKLGLPLEERHWEIPEGEQGLHASGHASGAELLSLIRSISPRILIPIHTENPEYFRESLQGTGIEVRLPQYGEEMEFG